MTYYNKFAPLLMRASAGGPPPPTSNIASIQQVSIVIAAGSASNTATITSVSTGRTAVFYNGFFTAETTGVMALVMPRIELTNSTTVTATRGSALGLNSVTVKGTVVEFTSLLVDSVQQGVISMSTAQTSNTATISSVDVTRSAVMILGFSGSDAVLNSMRSFPQVELTNATTVTATRNQTGTTTCDVGYAVIQFASGRLQSLQQINDSYAGAVSSHTVTISAVTLANSFIMWGGWTGSNANANQSMYAGRFTGTTSVSMDRSNANAITTTINCTVVEFVSGVLVSNQIETVATGTNPQDFAITAVNLSKTFINQVGCLAFSNTNPAIQFCSQELTSSTNYRQEKGAATGNPGIRAQILEFV